MAKKFDCDGYTVTVGVPVVTNDSWRYDKQTPQQAKSSAEQIRAAIIRHLSHEFSVKWDGISVERCGRFVCEHCGSAWTEKSNTYNGGCCDADEAIAPHTIKEGSA